MVAPIFTISVSKFFLGKYCVTNENTTLCHPQTSGQVEVSNREIKRNLEKVVGVNPKDWSLRLDDALWAYRTDFKTPIDTTSYRLFFGEHMLLQLDEFRGQAYDMALTYKVRTKQAHYKHIMLREFKEGEAVDWPYMITNVFSSGAITLKDGKNEPFTVNGQRLKNYLGGQWSYKLESLDSKKTRT
ncbi:uncharacterized protein [Primulina eburnea]|uniref:uncharacterized protein n=1 Tax=Primulina eburnea TaxID=1245227 RepID=UPI003C6CB489